MTVYAIYITLDQDFKATVADERTIFRKVAKPDRGLPGRRWNSCPEGYDYKIRVVKSDVGAEQ